MYQRLIGRAALVGLVISVLTVCTSHHPTPVEGVTSPPGPLMTACPEPFESSSSGGCVSEDRAWVSEGSFLTGCATAPQEPSAVWRCPPRFGLQRRISQSAFAIDRREVTRAAYHACVLAGVCVRPQCDLESTSAPHHELACHDLNGERDEHPITGVSLVDASTFCQWRGGVLPTSAQWEKAARGVDGRPFPWGQRPPHLGPDVIRINAADATAFEALGWRALDHGVSGRPDDESAYRDGHIGPRAVSEADPSAASPFGVLDMSGNVFEWTATDADPGQIIRGGSYASHGYQLRVDTWDVVSSTTRARWLGFRCVYPTEAMTQAVMTVQ